MKELKSLEQEKEQEISTHDNIQEHIDIHGYGNSKTLKQFNHRKHLYENAKKCSHVMSNGKKCKSVAKTGFDYCFNHLSEDIKSTIKTPSIPSQSNTTNEDLNFEITLLRKYLTQLVKSNPKGELDPKNLRIQFQLIEQIRKLVHSLSTMNSNQKLYSTVTKIINSIVMRVVEVINKHSIETSTKEIIANELMEIANNRNEDDDLNKLLKAINPNKRYEMR